MTTLLPGEDPRPLGVGWELADYTWDEQIGIAQLTYERELHDGTIQSTTVEQYHPAHPGHYEWDARVGPRFDAESTLAWLCDLGVELRRLEAFP